MSKEASQAAEDTYLPTYLIRILSGRNRLCCIMKKWQKKPTAAFLAKNGITFACYEKLMAWWMLLCFAKRHAFPWHTFG